MLMQVEIEQLEGLEVADGPITLVLYFFRSTVRGEKVGGLGQRVWSEEIGNKRPVLVGFDLADLRGALGGEPAVVLVACVEVKGRESQVVFATLAIKNLISLL